MSSVPIRRRKRKISPKPTSRPVKLTAKKPAREKRRKIDPKLLREVHEMFGEQHIREKSILTARERAARWWGSVAGILRRLWDDVQALEEEIGREGSPLAGFIDPDDLHELVLALERANNAATCRPPSVIDLPGPVER